MTTPEDVDMSRRIARAMHLGNPMPEERQRIIAAMDDADSWNDLAPDIRTKLMVWEKRGG